MLPLWSYAAGAGVRILLENRVRRPSGARTVLTVRDCNHRSHIRFHPSGVHIRTVQDCSRSVDRLEPVEDCNHRSHIRFHPSGVHIRTVQDCSRSVDRMDPVEDYNHRSHIRFRHSGIHIRTMPDCNRLADKQETEH